MNRPLLISVSINVLLFILLGVSIGLGVKAYYRQCPPASETTNITYRDSIVTVKDTILHTILSGTPKLIKHMPAAPSNEASVTVPQAICNDTNQYCQDVTVPDSYKASATATVSGNQLLFWDVQYVNLTPEKIRIKEVTNTIVEQPRSAMFRLYAGPFGMVGQDGRWGAGAKANLEIADGYQLGYGFDVKNLSHQFEFLIKIKLKK